MTKDDVATLQSPDGAKHLSVGVDKNGGHLWYSLADKINGEIVSPSKIALYDDAGRNLLHPDVDLARSELNYDETWEQPWGEQRFVRNNYNELTVYTNSFAICFRLFNEGVGFRYKLHGEGKLSIKQETTEFNIDTNSRAWWIPAMGQNHYEHLYQNTQLSEIGTAHTPITIELPKEKGFLAIHEAALYNYGSMNLVPTEWGVESRITPLNDGTIAKIELPFESPWRTLIVASKAYELGKSKMMLNLNEPSKIEDTSWIVPLKFMGIWWGMFIGLYTWASGDKHGATTANALRYINACKRLGIAGLLIEGWNEGWDGDWTKNGDIMKRMQPYPDFDIRTITDYAKSQGVEIIGHHETSGNAKYYEADLPEAYDYYKLFGVRYIKTGYVSPRFNNDDFHSSQTGVVHYQKTVELAAERQVMLDIHEPVKGTGIERTWPNLMTREGVMGQEYEGGAITPEHATVLPFTRSLAGPLDYTPGLFNLQGTSRKVQTTLAKQLAFYVTMYSPMQMVADLPEHYDGHPAFQFIKDVPTNWDQTLPLDGVIGDYFVVARKDRDSDNWFVGAVTDEESRSVTVSLDFLTPHRSYEMAIYQDSKDSHWQENPEAYQIIHQKVNSDTKVDVYLAPGGGFAISIMPDDGTVLPYPTIW